MKMKKELNESYIKSEDEINKAFENAIKHGMSNPYDWMYMYSTKDRDFFKHQDTRNYTSYKTIYTPIETIFDNLKDVVRKSRL